MHVAAMRDKCLSLYYFYTIGMDINIRDDK